MWRKISNTDFDLLVNSKRKKNNFDFNIDPEIDDDCKDIEVNKDMKYIKGGLNQSKPEQPITNNLSR